LKLFDGSLLTLTNTTIQSIESTLQMMFLNGGDFY